MKPIPSFLQEQLDRLAEHSETVSLWARSPINKAEMLRMRLGEMKSEKASVEANGGAVDHFNAEIQKLEVQIEASVAEHVRRRELAISADQALSTAKDFLARLPDGTDIAPAPKTKLGNGDAKKLVEIIRRDIADLYEQMGKLRARPQERAEVAAQAGAEVAHRARAALAYHPARGLSEIHIATVFGLVCAIMPAEVTRHLTDSYVETYSHGGLEPMGSPERAEALAATEAKLFALGLQEEALVEHLLEANGPTCVSRRRDADPRCICGLVVRPAQQKAPAAPQLEELVAASP